MRTIGPALACLALLTLTVAGAENLLLDGARDTVSWTASLGTEFPGATGALEIATDPERGPCVLGKFEFAGESRYAGALWSGSLPEARAIGFWVKLNDRNWGMVRVRDNTEQEFAGNFSLQPGQWTRIEIPLDTKRLGSHWGGANDGVMHFPLTRVLIAAGNKPASAQVWVSNLYAVTDTLLPEDRWKVVVEPSVPMGVAFPDEAASYRVTLINRLERQAKCEVALRTQEPGAQPAPMQTDSLTLAGWQQKEYTLRPSTKRLGYQRLSVDLRDAEGGDLPSITSGLAVVPQPRHYGKAAPGCYFGMQIIGDMEAAERLGAKAIRYFFSWIYSEGRQGLIRWEEQSDPLMAAAREHHMEVLFSVQAQAPGWIAWNDPERPKLKALPDPTRLPEWERYVRDITTRYRGQITALEIVNEPDLVCVGHVGMTVEEGADYYAKLLRLGRAGAKAGDPDVPIAGLDVSGGDYERGLQYSRAVLSRAADTMDLFPGHPYASPRYFGPGQNPKWPIANRMAEKLTEALDLYTFYGRPRRSWIGELGWGLQATADPLSTYSLDFAACIAQSLIVGKTVPGVERYLHFTQRGCNESGYEYGLMRGHPAYPLPAAVAYATAAYLLDDTQSLGLKQVGADLWSAVFTCKSRDELVTVLWSEGDEDLVRPSTTLPQGRWTSSLQEQLTPGTQGLKVGRMPVYWILPLSAVADPAEVVNQLGVAPVAPVTVENAFLAAPGRVGMLLRNRSDRSQRTTLSAGGASRTVEVAPGTQPVRVDLPLAKPINEPGVREMTATATVEGQTSTRAFTARYQYLPAPPQKLQVDGDLTEWEPVRSETLQDRRFILPPDPGIGWDGPQDLSLRGWLAADSKGLYFAVAATDDVHFCDQATAESFWKSDSLQLAIDSENDSRDGFDANDREVGLALTPQGPVCYVSYPGTPRQLAVPLAIRREGSVTSYEAILPWEALELPVPTDGKMLAISYIANDNDGLGRGYWMGLTPGIGEGKSPLSYRRFAVRVRP
jgi:hypothetical protein